MGRGLRPNSRHSVFVQLVFEEKWHAHYLFLGSRACYRYKRVYTNAIIKYESRAEINFLRI